MSRPKKNRIVFEPPIFTEFKPVGIANKLLDRVVLTLDEYEAFRLTDYLGMSHEEAAEEMEISRSTFTRLIEKTRKKIAELIVNGKSLAIDGGNIHFRNNIFRCYDCGYMFKTNISNSFIECPNCHSKNLINLAGGFGHGKCCNVQYNRGGNHARRR